MKTKSLFGILITGILYLQVGVAIANAAINQFLTQATESIHTMSPTTDFNSSWIDDADVRFSGNDVDDYSLALRFQPRFMSERNAQNRVIEILDRQNAFEVDAALNNALKQRYLVLLDLIEITNELQFQKELQQVKFNTLELNHSLVETEDFDIADLQAAEFDYRNNARQLEMLQNRLNRLLQSFDRSGLEEIEFFLEQWPEEVENWEGLFQRNIWLLQLHQNNNLEFGSEQLAFQLAQQKLKLSRSESGNWIKFVELKFNYLPDGDQETILGIAIPLSSDDLGISQRAAEVTRSHLRLQSGMSQRLNDIRRYDSELEWYREQELALLQSRNLLKQQFIRLENAGRPRVLLKLRGDMKNQEYLLRLNRLRALRGHIDLLHSAGYLASKPLTNWLLREQPRL